MDSNGNFLILSSEYKYILNKNIRFDVFYIISKINGTILSKYSLYENFKLYSNGINIQQKLLWPLDWTIVKDSKFEATHANSFYQIQGLKNDTNFMKNGDYIINVLGRIKKILIFDGQNFNLKNMVTPIPYFLHDVQVLPDGSLIYLNNILGSENMSRSSIVNLRSLNRGQSRIEIMDITNNKNQSYFTNDQYSFYMGSSGSLQHFPDGSILTLDFRDNTSTALLLSRSKEVLKKITMNKSGKIGIAYIKIKKLSLFLKKNIGI